jgi:hypothetical protein
MPIENSMHFEKIEDGKKEIPVGKKQMLLI